MLEFGLGWYKFSKIFSSALLLPDKLKAKCLFPLFVSLAVDCGDQMWSRALRHLSAQHLPLISVIYRPECQGGISME